MLHATEGQKSASRLRWTISWIVLSLVFAFFLNLYKTSALRDLGQQGLAEIESHHPRLLELFQKDYFSSYDDRFLPGIEKIRSEVPHLKQIQIISSSGNLVFDSLKKNRKPNAPGETFSDSEVMISISESKPAQFIRRFETQWLFTISNFGILYTLEDPNLQTQISIYFVLGIVVLGVLLYLGRRNDNLRRSLRWTSQTIVSSVKVGGLRVKFLSAVIAVNLITAAIVLVTVSILQTQEQTDRIRKDSMLFSQFSTAQIVNDFSNFYYFYFADKFLPSIKRVVAANENLIRIKIISSRGNVVLFDTDWSNPEVKKNLPEAQRQISLPREVEHELKTRDISSQHYEENGTKFLTVTNSYRNETQEVPFYIQYDYNMASLGKSVQAIRRQILIDLIPSMALGLLVAIVFSQLLISPIRRVVAALKRIATGDYDVAIDIKRNDEIGDLITAFNSMSGELKKKKELRKFLSDSTYRQIMESPESFDMSRVGGTRVQATVLFSDIRSFVSVCESMEAEEVISMLNEYFSEMVEIIYRYGGEVDKFIGDAILAVFYASDENHGQQRVKFVGGEISDDMGPKTPTSTSLQAIYCGLEMRERLRDFNARRQAVKKNTIDIGIGITYGDIISGPIGSKDRMDFTVIGDEVNLANRIEKLSKRGNHSKILFSEAVEEKVRGLLDYEEIPNPDIPGREEVTRVFELIRIRDLNALLTNLKASDFSLRKRSIELLGQSGNTDAIPHLIRLINDDSEDIRLQTVVALSKLSQESNSNVVAAMFDRLKKESSDRVVSALVSGIGRLCTDDRILELEPFLNSPDERIVANTVESMGHGRNPKCIDLLIPMLSSRNNRVKANAAMAVFAAGRIEVVNTLKPMLMHSDALMRSSAAFAIGELTFLAHRKQLLKTWESTDHGAKVFLGEIQECVPMLISLLKDREQMVKRQAIIALGKIKDRSTVLPLIDNIDLKGDSKEMIREISQALASIGSHKLVREVLSQMT